ncbi:MAG: T9SS type A sorting domain-containing protein [Ignavibacteriaceae bacterium]|nr:T9SS type A sorting domain-containing protein [Ignavibacteriaceae bacterium]
MLKYFSFFVLFNFITLAQTPVPISTIKQNDANGSPVNIGQIFTVSGVVTSSNQFGNNGPGSIQDETAGLSIYGSAFANAVQIGDSVTVTGKLDQFNGLCQINFNLGGGSVQINTSGNQINPEIVTIQQIKNQSWNSFEEYEGKLIRINNVTISGSGNFSGGTNYTISDASGSLSSGLRIDNDVLTIIGTPIPSGQVDLIGILGQYDPSPPYSTGYQILPRFIQDIVDDGSPVIINPVFAANITTTSFTVYFSTVRNGNSQVKYGLTPSLEIDSVIVDEDTTQHAVEVTGLQPSTLYYFKAYSTNAQGTSSSNLLSVSTASSDTTTGKINIYFNFSVDTSVAIPGNNARGNINFEQKLISRINAANYSIDLALYSFADVQNVANALVVAKNRGVKVRVVYEDRTNQNSFQTLVNAGIPFIKRTASVSGIMHNKFFIFDARDSISINDWVWTGSWNVTATENGWENNVIEINDPALANAYKIEFEEMWGSNTDTPNPSNARFGNQKLDNTPHSFSIGGRDVNLYFSPSDLTTARIINTIGTANHSIYLALYVITRGDIKDAIVNRFNAGVNDIRGIVDQVNSQGTEFYNLQTVAEMLQNVGNTLHHKYAIIDASYPESFPLIITGSHNWSTSAEAENDENCIIVKDLLIANQYLQEFKKRYNESGGTGTFIVPTSSLEERFQINDMSMILYQNYPNPFNPITTIKVELPATSEIELNLFDVLGNKVKTLFKGVAPQGILSVDLTADDLASGVYFYTLYSANRSITKKMVLLR